MHSASTSASFVLASSNSSSRAWFSASIAAVVGWDSVGDLTAAKFGTTSSKYLTQSEHFSIFA